MAGSKTYGSPIYAVYPSVKLLKYPENSRKKLVFYKELLFGDYILPYLKDGHYIRINIEEGDFKGEFIKVHCRKADGYIRKDDYQRNRVLEVNFVDVGQGDGCHIVTPDDNHFLVDAGASDNMYRYLKWRFNLKTAKKSAPAFTVVISHSDTDHYQGLGKVFVNSLTPEEKKELEKALKEGKTVKDVKGADELAQKLLIGRILHNGMVEASVDKSAGTGKELKRLGTLVEVGKSKYISDLCDTNEQYQERIKGVKVGKYISTLEKSSAPKYAIRQGMDPIYTFEDKNTGMDMKIEVMGPYPEDINGKDALPVFSSDDGKTKNGHSVILKLTIGHLKLLLGGDLNTDSEYYLIKKYSGIDVAKIIKELKKTSLSVAKRQELEAQLDEAVRKAREFLEVDIAKSCHHGSADFTSEFLRVLNPIATVISSGDEESYSHPRPDTLGTIGKFSRGERSLIFCTELARSSKEFIELYTAPAPKKNKKDEQSAEESTPESLKKYSQQKRKERAVTVYGMINVRTDGDRVVIAQKLEQPAAKSNWDIHRLEWNEEKQEFEYILRVEK